MNKVLMMSVVVPLLLAAGCGKEQSAESEPKGKVAVERSGSGETQEITIETDEGKVMMRSGLRTPTEQELGVPIYPRATSAEGASWDVSGSGAEGEHVYSAVSLHSADSISLVSTFYQRRLRGERPQVTEMSGPQGKMVSFMLEGKGTTITLIEDQQDGGTNIQIMKGQ